MFFGLKLKRLTPLQSCWLISMRLGLRLGKKKFSYSKGTILLKACETIKDFVMLMSSVGSDVIPASSLDGSFRRGEHAFFPCSLQ